MYHHVGADKFSNSVPVLENHLKYISEHFNVVLPGDELSKTLPNICLIFDDASYSFYSITLPLIRHIGVRVVLAVSPKYIVDSGADIAPSIRLSVPADDMMQGDNYLKTVPFCSWMELEEICASGLVKVASHSFSHSNLLHSPHVEDELVRSKEILQQKLALAVDSFVYPYGQFNASIVDHVRKYYRYGFAVGAGDNRTWDGVGGILFRIFADDLPDPTSMFSRLNLKKYELLRYRLIAKKWFMDNKQSV